MRVGGQSRLLKDLIYGKTSDAEDNQLRAQAMWATAWEVLLTGQGSSYYLPIFADRNLDHELRIGALEMIMYTQPTAAQMTTIISVLYKEKDYEVRKF